MGTGLVKQPAQGLAEKLRKLYLGTADNWLAGYWRL